MGVAAARDVAAAMREKIAAGRLVRMIFAAAPSQQDMLDALIREGGVDWSRVVAFHMDDYIGLPSSAPQLFANWLKERLFDRVKLGATHLIDASGDPDRAALRYAELLNDAPIDIVCLGIGVNGHLAFNDPPVADLNDPLDVKIVELDDICRQQQVDDGCFPGFSDVPQTAITLTIPRLLLLSATPVLADADGFLRITDRQSRFSKIGGEMVPHAGVESAIIDLTKTSDHELVVTGIPDLKRGERLAVIYSNLGMSPDQVYKQLNASVIPKLWIPSADDFVQVEAIPILGTGKIDLRQVRQIAIERLTGKQ